MYLLPTNLAPLASVAAKDATKFALSAVQVEVNADNTYRAVATDSKRLLMVDGTCEDANEFPDLPGMAGAPNGGTSALVPAKAWASTFSAAAKLTRKVAQSKPALANVATVIGKNEVTFGATDLEKTAAEQTRQLEGRFPPYREIFPKATPKMVVNVDAKMLADLLKAAAAIAGDGRVTLEFVAPDRPFVLRATNAKQKVTGLMMPLS